MVADVGARQALRRGLGLRCGGAEALCTADRRRYNATGSAAGRSGVAAISAVRWWSLARAKRWGDRAVVSESRGGDLAREAEFCGTGQTEDALCGRGDTTAGGAERSGRLRCVVT